MSDVGKTVTRYELYDAVYQKVGLSRTESSAFVELVLEEIKDSIARGETVKLSSFGTFTVRKKGQRMVEIPRRVRKYRSHLVAWSYSRLRRS